MFAWLRSQVLFKSAPPTAPVPIDSGVDIAASRPASQSTPARRRPTPALVRPAPEHAQRLLLWFQSDCNDAARADGVAHVVDWDEVRWGYETMCRELNWLPLSWNSVGRHFRPLTGGKHYRNVIDSRTGRRQAKERIYTIPRLPPTRRQRNASEATNTGERIAA